MPNWVWLLLMIIGIAGTAITKPPANSAVAFDPKTISGLTVWLKADTGITKDGSNLVSDWNDQSGNGNNFSQSTAGNKPLYTASAQNGLPAIVFDGSNDFLTTAASVTLGTYSTFVVASRAVWKPSAYAGIWGHNFSAAGTAGRALGVTGGALNNWQNNEFFSCGNGYGPSQTPYAFGPIGTYSNSTYHLISAGNGTANSFVRCDRASVARAVVNAAVTSSSTRFSLGTWYLAASSDFWNGGIAEVLIYNSVLSSTDIASVENYLRNKWQTP
jgi:hypothetical protein